MPSPAQEIYNTAVEGFNSVLVPYVAGELGQMPAADKITDQVSYVGGLIDPVQSRYHVLFRKDNGEFEYVGSTNKEITDIKELMDLPDELNNAYVTNTGQQGILTKPKTNDLAQYLGAFDTLTAGRFKKYDQLQRYFAQYVFPGEQLKKHIKYSTKMQLGNSRFYMIDSLHPHNLATNWIYWNWRSGFVNGVDKTGAIGAVEGALEGSSVHPYIAFQNIYQLVSNADHLLTGIEAADEQTATPDFPAEIRDLNKIKAGMIDTGKILSILNDPPAAAAQHAASTNWVNTRIQELYGP